MSHIYLSYPEIESMNVCPVGHPLISTHYLWEREICNFSREQRRYSLIDNSTTEISIAKRKFIINT